MKKMRVCIIKDTSKPMRGLHGLQTAFRGMPNVEVTGFYDPNSDNIESRMEYVGAKTHYTDMETMFQTERPDIVILTSGLARKPGQTRLDLAQANVNITKQIIPQITKYVFKSCI